MRIKLNSLNLTYWCILCLLGSRLLVALGFPSIFNFLHFAILIIIVVLKITKEKLCKNGYTICLLVMTTLILVSSILNVIAPLNTALTILILLEPFILVANCEKWNENYCIRIENMLTIFSLVNLVLSYFQYFILHLRDDDVRGIFLRMGSGGHLNGAFSIVMAIYYIYIARKYEKNPKIRAGLYTISILCLFIVIMCDNKQSILGYGIGLLLLLLSNVKNLKIVFKNFVIICCGIVVFLFLSQNILSKAMTWLGNMNYVIDGIYLKFSFIEVLREYRSSLIQLFFGFGPGMTLSRVARLLPEYQSLSFLGVSYSNVTQHFKDIYAGSWLMQASSLWMFYFSFASFFGDLGLFGLIGMITLYIASVKKLCHNQLSRYLMFVVFSHGLLFDWLEEPSFMVVYLIIIVLINYDWKTKNKRLIFKL